MPTYDYKCPEGHSSEEYRGINSDPVALCPTCGKSSERIIGAGSGLMFKGSGFYITDYKKPGSSGNNGAEKKSKDPKPEKE